MPTVTVVIPTYNRVDELGRAVDSVLAQTCEDIELVVVNDGSDDGTLSMLDAYDDHRLEVITHLTNRGANVARNTGITHADGEFVAFLDSDDSWHPRKLERQLRRYEAAPDDCVAVYCDFEYDLDGTSGDFRSTVAEMLSRTDEERPKEGGVELAGEILADHLHSGAGSTLLVETAVARAIEGFDVTLDRFQDPDFLLRVIQEGELAYVDEPLVTRYETGTPSAAAIARADEAFISKHASLVRAAERDGYNVRTAHNLVLTKAYLEEGAFVDAARYLKDARLSVRQLPGVLWSAGSGVRRKAAHG
ncbi:glycosyltransferase family 2 protein [Haloarcula onubensis]|uniref:Glycosyltransferase n=1 Tax=Haloarcula onubensis TaxID=2950539 RepID=A0ABU2FPH7_9EURY|nr:glycosyltransferase family 2 protein [Halomicroarcula sp. S3CR25-11]MDS0282650.1 glycosyltransferase [Halomicroarcula sp. S3CR25-11]